MPTLPVRTILSSAAMLSLLGAKAQKPNVVFILADDLGIGDVSGINPRSRIETPELDAMCRSGIVFTDAHAASALSTPSRYGILTGRYCFRTALKEGVLNGFSAPLIAAGRPTVASMLSACGYATACIGKWHLGWNWTYREGGNKDVDYSLPITEGPTTRGFDYFYGTAGSLDMPPYVWVENDRATSIPDRTAPEGKAYKLLRPGPQAPDFEPIDVLPDLTAKAIEYIKGQKGSGKPFFLYVPLTAPHTPILPTPEWQGKSRLIQYGDFVMMLDNMVGQIVAALKKSGQYDNTIVVFTSDNGCYPGAGVNEMERKGHYPSYIYRGFKSDIYEGGHRIPLILTWGKKVKHRTEKGLVSLIDLYATLADMAGHRMSQSEGEDSYSFWPLLKGKGAPAREDAVFSSGDGSFSIREGDWKLIFCAGSGGWGYPSLPRDRDYIATQPKMQLYNLKDNPEETRNLVGEHPGIVERLSAKMRRYILDGRSTPGEKQTNETTDKEWKQTALFMQTI
ncbi:arylsulfatase [Bacteroidia bacterium]|nr:arylsulfatase [Bacteroidia bacterium]